MPKTVDNYIIQKQLFKDSFQIQYILCEHKVLKKPYILKKIQKPTDTQNNQKDKSEIKLIFAYSCIQNQIRMCRELKSDKIIKCLKILKAKNATYAVYDQHPEKSLQKIISTQYLTSEKKQMIINQIIQFIKQLHSQNIIIGNLNPQHLYFTPQFKLFTSNLLIAKRLSSKSQIIDQTYLNANCKYYAPQLLKKEILSHAADIYSLGTIFKTLKLQHKSRDLLSPVQCISYRDLISRMTDQATEMRPTILEVQKAFLLNKSRNKSTCQSNVSGEKDYDKHFQSKRLSNYKSESTIRTFKDRSEASVVIKSDSKKILLTKRQSLNSDLNQYKTKYIPSGRSKADFDPEVTYESSKLIMFQVPGNANNNKKSTVGNSGIRQSTYQDCPSPVGQFISQVDISIKKGSLKERIKQIILIRSVVSFLLQMSIFVQGQCILNQLNSSHQLSYLLIKQAMKYSHTLVKNINYIVIHQSNITTEIEELFVQCKKQKQKLIQICEKCEIHIDQNMTYELLFVDQLKRFGKVMLNNYSLPSNINHNTTLNKVSHVSDTCYKSKIGLSNQGDNHHHNKQRQKDKQRQDKLFKTLLILKRIQYGNYYDFFKAKLHHLNTKFWNQHYFQFQKTFGYKYFIMQIKDIITKRQSTNNQKIIESKCIESLRQKK